MMARLAALALTVVVAPSIARAQKVDLDEFLKPAPAMAKEATKSEAPTSEPIKSAPAAASPATPEPTATTSAAPSKKERKSRERVAVAEKPKRVRKKTAYDLLAEKWHAPAPADLSAKHAQTAVPDLIFIVQKTGEQFTLHPASRDGGFDETQLQIAKTAFNSWGPTPHPRTLDLVYAATLHFNAPYVTLISGVRKDRGGSRHSHGLAADIVLPGVDDETLAEYFRAQGFCGVGTYPRAHFVHIDTRDQSFFWVDNSKPNQRTRVQAVRKDEAIAADEAARSRGADGFVNPPRLAKALRVRAVRKRKAAQAKVERAAAAKAAEDARSTQPMPSSTSSER